MHDDNRGKVRAGFQQKTSDQQGPSGPSQAPGSGSTGDSKRPQATQHKALKLQPTMQIVRDLEAVPPGCAVHGYSLVRGQMLRGGTLHKLSALHTVHSSIFVGLALRGIICKIVYAQGSFS